jgi:hypothetical protein
VIGGDAARREEETELWKLFLAALQRQSTARHFLDTQKG